MSLTLKEFKKKYISIYPNSDLDNSQLSDYYYLSFLRDPYFGDNVKEEKYPLDYLLSTSPTELKSLLGNIGKVQIKKYPLLPWLHGFNEKKLVYQEYYPNSKLTDRILLPLFQLLVFKKESAHWKFYQNFSDFNSPLIKYGTYNPADFNKLKNIYLLYNKPHSDSELEAVFSLFYHLNHGASFEEYFRIKYESNLRKKIPFLAMNNNELWGKFFPNAEINQYDKKQIYNLFKKDFPNDSFSDYLEGMTQNNTNYDWKAFLKIFLPDIKTDSFPDSLLFSHVKYPVIDFYDKKL